MGTSNWSTKIGRHAHTTAYRDHLLIQLRILQIFKKIKK